MTSGWLHMCYASYPLIGCCLSRSRHCPIMRRFTHGPLLMPKREFQCSPNQNISRKATLPHIHKLQLQLQHCAIPGKYCHCMVSKWNAWFTPWIVLHCTRAPPKQFLPVISSPWLFFPVHVSVDVMGELLSELPRFYSTWLSFLCTCIKDFDHFFHRFSSIVEFWS